VPSGAIAGKTQFLSAASICLWKFSSPVEEYLAVKIKTFSRNIIDREVLV
jgi:hypothetical protein